MGDELLLLDFAGFVEIVGHVRLLDLENIGSAQHFEIAVFQPFEQFTGSAGPTATIPLSVSCLARVFM